MKTPMKFLLLTLASFAHAAPTPAVDLPPISFVLPGAGASTIDRSQYIILVVEAGFISHNGSPIPHDGVISYVNAALKAEGAAFVGIHVRPGITFGEVVRAFDQLRQTNARSIGVSMVELPVGREP